MIVSASDLRRMGKSLEKSASDVSYRDYEAVQNRLNEIHKELARVLEIKAYPVVNSRAFGFDVFYEDKFGYRKFTMEMTGRVMSELQKLGYTLELRSYSSRPDMNRGMLMISW